MLLSYLKSLRGRWMMISFFIPVVSGSLLIFS